jgi:hypothetical protein
MNAPHRACASTAHRRPPNPDGIQYVWYANPTNDDYNITPVSRLAFEQPGRSGGRRTIRHNQAAIIYLLPIIERLDHGRLPFLLGQVIIILHKVAHDKLAALDCARSSSPSPNEWKSRQRSACVKWSASAQCAGRTTMGVRSAQVIVYAG